MKTGFIELEKGGNNLSQSYTVPNNRSVADILKGVGATIGPADELPVTESLYYKVVYQGDVIMDDGQRHHARVWESTE